MAQTITYGNNKIQGNIKICEKILKRSKTTKSNQRLLKTSMSWVLSVIGGGTFDSKAEDYSKAFKLQP